MYLVLFAIVAIWLFYEMYWKRRNLPPGPFAFPLIGNVPQFFWHQPGYQFFEDNKSKFNPIYTWWLGPSPIVTICDFELMKETFVRDGDSYTDKFYFKGMNEEFRGGNYGIVEAGGDRWREHRRFALHQMRDLGLGKMKMEGKIMTEIDELTHKFIEKGTVEIQSELQHAVANVINQMMFGYRFEGDRKKDFDELMELLDKQQNAGQGVLMALLIFAWARKLPFFKNYWAEFMVFRDKFFGFFERQIEQHKNEFDYEAEDSTDYVEAYLKEKRKREAEGDLESFSDIQLKNMCFDLWAAGLNTTTSTLQWGIVYLLNAPEVQAKMQAEMDRVIGSSRPITMNDKPSLPYTSAVIMEIQRALNLTPTNLPHATTRDVQVAGHMLPKGTTVTADIGCLLYDRKLFPNPEKFDPERFLEGGKIRMYPEVMPFSLGKRACPGEGFAKMELFMLIANLFNRFRMTTKTLPSLKKTFKNIQKPEEQLFVDMEYRF